MTQVQRIIEAQKHVEQWAQFLSTLDVSDPRFDGSLLAYERSIELRRIAERAHRRESL